LIADLSLEVATGEFLVMLGPSGCGKSTVLRMIAGLESVTTGEVRIAGRDVTHLSPGARGVAMVFQSYALYPHLSVEDNMAFGLRNVGLPEAEVVRRIQGGQAARERPMNPTIGCGPMSAAALCRLRPYVGCGPMSAAALSAAALTRCPPLSPVPIAPLAGTWQATPACFVRRCWLAAAMRLDRLARVLDETIRAHFACSVSGRWSPVTETPAETQVGRLPWLGGADRPPFAREAPVPWPAAARGCRSALVAAVAAPMPCARWASA
jgi:hypothetical protein